VKRHQTLLRVQPEASEQILIEKELPMMLRACRRGKGEPRHVEPLTEEHLSKIRSAVHTIVDHFTWDLLVLEWFFLLRSEEALNLCPNAITFLLSGENCLPGRAAAVEQGVQAFTALEVARGITPPGEPRRFRIRLQIVRDKVNQQGRDVHRFLDCVCPVPFDASCVPLCPVHCASRLVRRHRGPTHVKCDPGLGLDPPTSSRYLACIRFLIAAAGIRRTELFAGEPLERFGTHSLRRGGAQALALGGWSLDAIKFFGRWLSSAVELYLLDIPYKAEGHKLASSMVPNHRMVGELEGCNVVKTLTIRPIVVGALLKVLFPAPAEIADFLGRPLDESSQLFSGWFEVRVIRVEGDLFGGPPSAPLFVWWKAPSDSELVELSPLQACPPSCYAVVPAAAKTCEKAICFNFTAFSWMRL
jgi:hypothetical protein